jgi:hypothetical protein
MRARTPFLNLKTCFDAFNAVRGDVGAEQRAATARASDRLDVQYAELFADAPSQELVGSE